MEQYIPALPPEHIPPYLAREWLYIGLVWFQVINQLCSSKHNEEQVHWPLFWIIIFLRDLDVGVGFRTFDTCGRKV